MEWPTAVSRLRASIGSGHCICLCRALTTHTRLNDVPHQFRKRRQTSFPSTAHHKKSRTQEIDRRSFRNRGADNFGEGAERRRMSAEFAAMRREELERFSESSSKTKTTKSIERKSSIIRHSPKSRISSSSGLNRRDEKVQFPNSSSSRLIVDMRKASAKPTSATGKRTPSQDRSSRKPIQDSIPEMIPSKWRTLAPGRLFEQKFPSLTTKKNVIRMSPNSRERSKTSSPTAKTTKPQNPSLKLPSSSPTKSLIGKVHITKSNTDSHRQSKIAKRDLFIPIISESPHIVCINKPPALLSQPGLPGEGTILELLRYQRPDLTLQTVNRYVLSNQC
jgi:hypothetical protein